MPSPALRKMTRPLHRSPPVTDGYFESVLKRLAAIRRSEREFSQKIGDLFTTSVDYMEDAEATAAFFRSVQNRFHYAVHGHSAAELIAERADAAAAHMGLTHWKNGPDGSVRKSDVAVAKNYLTEGELRQLYLMVDQYLSFGELQALGHRAMRMNDWSRKLDELIAFNERASWPETERISGAEARGLAEREYEMYKARRRAVKRNAKKS